MKKLTIIGGGPAGYAAALYASNFELEITLIESDTLGGTCLNRGCIPAKYWLHVAELNHEIDNSKDFYKNLKFMVFKVKERGQKDFKAYTSEYAKLKACLLYTSPSPRD